MKTLALRHQFYMYLFHKQENLLVPDEPVTTYSKEVLVNLLDGPYQNAIRHVTSNDLVTLSKSVTFEGLIYDQGCAVVLSAADDTFAFACICQNFFIDNKLYLLCENLSTVGFNRHYNSYEVSFTNEFEVYTVDELYDNHPLGIYDVRNLRDCHLVTLKYNLRFRE